MRQLGLKATWRMTSPEVPSAPLVPLVQKEMLRSCLELLGHLAPKAHLADGRQMAPPVPAEQPVLAAKLGAVATPAV